MCKVYGFHTGDQNLRTVHVHPFIKHNNNPSPALTICFSQSSCQNKTLAVYVAFYICSFHMYTVVQIILHIYKTSVSPGGGEIMDGKQKWVFLNNSSGHVQLCSQRQKWVFLINNSGHVQQFLQRQKRVSRMNDTRTTEQSRGCCHTSCGACPDHSGWSGRLTVG